MTWLKIDSDPPLVFYSPGEDRSLFSDYLAFPFLISAGSITNRVSMDGGGENANVPIELDHGHNYETTLLLEDPPLFEFSTLYEGSSELFSGIIMTVSISESGNRLSIEA